ncbi:MAG: helix-turn-helix domain-containing protein [Erysipelotrichaceae bacterium]
MEKELRFKIIQEAMQVGVKTTCEKYHISRTIYYRWLKRYKALGMDGLSDQKKQFVPNNKTTPELEASILALVKTYPNYGPKALKYLAEESQLNISESAIFNIFKRNNLTTKEARRTFARKTSVPTQTQTNAFTTLQHGEAWMFWITYYGSFEGIGHLYEYTLYDIESRIACSRIYQTINIQYVEDLLQAVALPVALSLQLRPRLLCQWKEDPLKLSTKNCKTMLQSLSSLGMELELSTLDAKQKEHQNVLKKKQHYTQACLTYVLPQIQQKVSYEALKLHVQDYNRHYNLVEKQDFGVEVASPIDHHNNETKTRIILPLWAYLERPY